ncbi:MAG TPA: hypothetical protein DDW95_07560 [Alphaproteobacteria bacterium]|nr:hypothetical protein [Alphaproteobacteria bacterium]HAM48199.1 hypothetical protein [Alphaproteobacteria bacterium]HBA43123.1 hypothetical protein [Alphaproteobacteria bacterium]HBC54326.1 hypothetical protein [Alphaproteobacteria bacterium]HBF98390.1 hypothetical protein [Alphaproteobacteria bacterium]
MISDFHWRGKIVQAREKFATQISSDLLAELRNQAKEEGRQIQSLVEEAIAALIEERRHGKARTHVMSAYQKSHFRFAPLYDKLAK